MGVETQLFISNEACIYKPSEEKRRFDTCLSDSVLLYFSHLTSCCSLSLLFLISLQIIKPLILIVITATLSTALSHLFQVRVCVCVILNLFLFSSSYDKLGSFTSFRLSTFSSIPMHLRMSLICYLNDFSLAH